MNSPNRTTPRVTVAGAGCGLCQDSDSSLSARSPAKAALDKSPRLRSGRRHCTASRRRSESGVYTVTAGTGRMRTWVITVGGKPRPGRAGAVTGNGRPGMPEGNPLPLRSDTR